MPGMDEQGMVTVADAATTARPLDRAGATLPAGGPVERPPDRRAVVHRRAAVDHVLDGLREQRGFLEKIKPARAIDPFEGVIGIGRGGGSNIAEGKEAYRRAFRWRR